MTLQTGVRIYQFVRDRLDDQRDEQHPHGHQAYVDAWRKAQDLSQDHANAVASEDTSEAERVLQELYGMADEWKHHLDYPAAPAVPPTA
ncbi:hypothetical protein ACGFMO_37315 [Streptomyces niveus]|uniref:hypothetical protein n=1 Tax=Streptomyces niveus TaxID=193462 RepID=UPI00372017F9